MAYELWSQDIFSKGELSPYMYARATTNEYGNGLKTAQNVLTYPTGAAGKRFGTLYQTTFDSSITNANQFYFNTFQYLDECVYQVMIAPGTIYIFLEGIQVATVSNSFNAYVAFHITITVLGNIFRITGTGIQPMDLTRSSNSGISITSFTGPNYLVASSASLTVGQVLPVDFSNSGVGSALPTTDPQIIVGVTYFINAVSATMFSVYSSSYNAKFNIDPFTILDAGMAAVGFTIFNTWTLANTTFKNLPVYDFNGATTSYDALTFTPSATMGTSVTVTVSDAGYSLLDSSYVGGAFIGAGGTSRITAVASATSFTVSVQTPFDSTDPIQGSLAFLAEPAWSAKRGYPKICSSYQNRAIFANTTSLPNGFWTSVVNDYSNFGDLTNDDDDAISWYPTSNNVNYIRFVVPYRSITVHTNTGIYSSPLSDIVAITPSNFTLQLQDSTPADVLLPQAIDNQILVLSGDDAHQMIWDGINNAYTSDIVSVINEQTIRNPVDETPFSDLRRAGSRYVFIINENGTMAVFQTLISQNVSGFTPQVLEQSYGSAQFIQTGSSADGRCWFVVQRQIASNQTPIALSGYTVNTLKATASNFSTTEPTAITFTTTGALPTSTPQLEILTYYWAIGIDADDFTVYLDQADALAGENPVQFTNAGTSSYVVPWPLNTIFTMEELTQDTYLDCAVQYGPQQGAATDTVTTGALFNAQAVKMVGDGYGYDAIGVNNEVVFEAHGSTVDVTNAYIGFPINTIMEPMPLTIANGPSAKNTTLTKPKHIRTVRFMFNNTIGGTINGIPIALEPFNMAHIGEPPFPARGIFEMSVMKGWDDFNNPTYTISHNDPFNIELLGVFYSVDI